MKSENTPPPVAIVTGASSGIGLGVTQALLARGWRVVGTSRSISKSQDLKPSSDLVLVKDLQSATFVTGENIRVDGGVHAGR